MLCARYAVIDSIVSRNLLEIQLVVLHGFVFCQFGNGNRLNFIVALGSELFLKFSVKS